MDGDAPNRNWLFLVIMVGLTLALAAAMVRRPVRFTTGELVVAIVVPAVLGGFLLVAGLLFGGTLPAEGTLSGPRVVIIGAAMLVGAAAIYALAWVGGRAGIGPLARRMALDPDAPVPAPPPDGWLRPGGRGIVGWLFALFCLTAIPVAVYVVMYIPWANLGNQLVPGFPAGNTGQTLWDLTKSMYDYHNDLRAIHAASSPWWAWPLDLKPVWFYQESFANETAGSIYDSGNLVIFWMGIPALLFASWAAWTRRNLALTAVVVMFCAMWLPWARIDRATFQYHVYTSLPFVVLALAYLLAELWHGPSRVGWTLARVAGALAIIGAPLMWLLRKPLCAIAGRREGQRGQPGLRRHRDAQAAAERAGLRGGAGAGRGCRRDHLAVAAVRAAARGPAGAVLPASPGIGAAGGHRDHPGRAAGGQPACSAPSSRRSWRSAPTTSRSRRCCCWASRP